MRRLSKTIIATAVTCGLVSVAHSAVLPDVQSNSPWFTDGQAAIEKQLSQAPKSNAKNVILFVGDGMGISTITAARILAGQRNGGTGEENFLSFETMPYSAQVKTYNTNQQTPDSAGTMTAMMTGVKTKAGVINIAVPTPERAMAFILIPVGAFLILVSGVLWFEEALTDERSYYEFVLGPGIGLAANYMLVLMLSYSAQPGEAGGSATVPSQDD